MYDNYNYPPGADTPDAPWNEVEIPEIEVRCEVSVTLTKKDLSVFTDNYINNGDECGDEYEILDSYNELAEKVGEQHYSLTDLLNELADYIKRDLCADLPEKRKRELREMLADAEGWEEYCVEVDEYEIT